MSLTSKQRSHLRTLAHHLKPVVIIGDNGVTDAVLAEIELALDHHELIKVKINAGDRPDRQAISEYICEKTACARIQNIGRIAVLYRPAKEPVLKLPKSA